MENIVKRLIFNENGHKKNGLLQVVTPIIIRSVYKFSINYQPSLEKPADLYHSVER